MNVLNHTQCRVSSREGGGGYPPHLFYLLRIKNVYSTASKLHWSSAGPSISEEN